MGPGVRGLIDCYSELFSLGSAGRGCCGCGGGGAPYRWASFARTPATFLATRWSRATSCSSSRSGNEGSNTGRYEVSTVSWLLPGRAGSAQALTLTTPTPTGRRFVGRPVRASNQGLSTYPSRRWILRMGIVSAWRASASRRVASRTGSRSSWPAASGRGANGGRVVEGWHATATRPKPRR